ncbi:RDD domain-containing protein [Microcystis aeruginosa]
MVYPIPPEDNLPQKFPKIPLDRRAYAFLIDFASIWFLSSFANSAPVLQFLLFLLIWWCLRVLLVAQNQGQSLGRWALDMKVIDLRLQRLPGIFELSKREAIAGGGAALMMVGLNTFFGNPLSLILLSSPLFADCGMAIGDDRFNRAFHDRIGGTIVISTRRGFSLDLRLRRLWYQVKGRMRR